LMNPFKEKMTMKTTLSVIKADVGSIGGHIQPSKRLVEEVKNFVGGSGKGLVADSYISYTGDDIAILMAHSRGKGDEKIHQLAWDALLLEPAWPKNRGCTERVKTC
jgi:fructose 1,6-bisphosphate aldolase/phosphatase